MHTAMPSLDISPFLSGSSRVWGLLWSKPLGFFWGRPVCSATASKRHGNGRKTPKSKKHRSKTLNPDSPSPLTNSDATCYPRSPVQGGSGAEKQRCAREFDPWPCHLTVLYFLVFLLDRQTAWGFLKGVPFIPWFLRWFVFCGTSLWQPGSSTDWRVIIDAYRVWERDRGSRGLIRLFSLIVFMFTGFRDVGCKVQNL